MTPRCAVAAGRQDLGPRPQPTVFSWPSMCKSGSSWRTSETLPSSVPQKSTLRGAERGPGGCWGGPRAQKGSAAGCRAGRGPAERASEPQPGTCEIPCHWTGHVPRAAEWGPACGAQRWPAEAPPTPRLADTTIAALGAPTCAAAPAPGSLPAGRHAPGRPAPPPPLQQGEVTRA